jgi:hypothetical protein
VKNPSWFAFRPKSTTLIERPCGENRDGKDGRASPRWTGEMREKHPDDVHGPVPVLAGNSIRGQILAVLTIESQKIEPDGVTNQDRHGAGNFRPGCALFLMTRGARGTAVFLPVKEAAMRRPPVVRAPLALLALLLAPALAAFGPPPAGPRPALAPAAVAAGAPQRATLLARIATAEGHCAAGAAVLCHLAPGAAGNGPALNAYLAWYESIVQCHADGRGGYVFTAMRVTPTPDQLRDPAYLDTYSAGGRWCGLAQP